MSGAHSAPSTTATSGRARLARLLVPGLLLVALVLLVVGLVLSSPGWLAASLVGSVLAALVLVGERVLARVQARRRDRAGEPEGDPAGASGTEPEPKAEPVAERAPDPEPPTPIDPDDPNAVWVVDGRPRYHRRDCSQIASLTGEAISREQALEDGFVACSLCDPAAPAPAEPVPAESGARRLSRPGRTRR